MVRRDPPDTALFMEIPGGHFWFSLSTSGCYMKGALYIRTIGARRYTHRALTVRWPLYTEESLQLALQSCSHSLCRHMTPYLEVSDTAIYTEGLWPGLNLSPRFKALHLIGLDLEEANLHILVPR